MSVIVLTTLSALLPSDPREATGFAVLVRSLILLISAVSAGLLCTRVFENLGPAEFGISSRRAIRYAVLGVVVGLFTLLTAIAPAAALGSIAFHYNSFEPVSLLTALGLFGVAAAWEEGLFRGYVLQTLARAGYAWPAVLITAAVFGLGHAANPGSTSISILNTVLAGVWFGVAYLRTRNLWFVWGIHLAWNWAQGSVLGIEVSGLKEISGTPLLVESDMGPRWLSGGDYGIEASLSAAFAILLCTGLIWFVAGKKAVGSGDLNFEADIDRPSRMRDAPDRDQINPGLGE